MGPGETLGRLVRPRRRRRPRAPLSILGGAVEDPSCPPSTLLPSESSKSSPNWAASSPCASCSPWRHRLGMPQVWVSAGLGRRRLAAGLSSLQWLAMPCFTDPASPLVVLSGVAVLAVLLSTRLFSAASDFDLEMLTAVAWLGAVSSSLIAPGGFPSLLGVRGRRRCSWRGVLLASCRSGGVFCPSGREAGSCPSSRVSVSLADGAASSSQDERVGALFGI